MRLPKEGTTIDTSMERPFFTCRQKVQKLTHELKRYPWDILALAETDRQGLKKLPFCFLSWLVNLCFQCVFPCTAVSESTCRLLCSCLCVCVCNGAFAYRGFWMLPEEGRLEYEVLMYVCVCVCSQFYCSDCCGQMLWWMCKVQWIYFLRRIGLYKNCLLLLSLLLLSLWTRDIVLRRKLERPI